ncbi:MAG: hypothetical protein R3A79_11790 [Nannocystaceae bacterium]
MLALLLGVLALAPPAGTVDVDGARWRSLVEGAPREVAPPGPWVADRQVRITREGDGLALRGRWTIRALRPGWFMGDLLGPYADIRKATWNGAPAAIERVDDGIVVAGFVERDVTLEVEAFIAGDPSAAPLTLDLLPAIAGEVVLPPAASEGSIVRATLPAQARPPPKLTARRTLLRRTLSRAPPISASDPRPAAATFSSPAPRRSASARRPVSPATPARWSPRPPASA